MRDASHAFLIEIANTASPSGYEQDVARLYREYVGQFTEHVETYVHGNVTAVLNPDAPMKIMLAGHMDEIGFIVHHIDANGFLSFSSIGGNDSVVPIGQRVWVHGRERVPGIIGRKAMHLMGNEETQKKPVLGELWIDIGACSKAEAEAALQLGDVVTFQHEFQILMGDRVAARGLDNKAGMFIVAEAMRLLSEGEDLDPSVGVYAVATVQEEIGSRGAQTSAFRIGAQSGIAVDMEQAVDYPGVIASQYGERDIGKGPTIARGANTNHKVFHLLTEAARAEQIPFQVSVLPGTSPTDENKMQLSRDGMATGLIGVALRYMHTPSELVSLTDVEDCARLLAGYCRLITPDTDFTP
ncbi:M20/M25/M40 family metallo-hydrolase [Phyllobacterium endophyticum]|uniref:M20/M25/M40 family metallo-hydrolase n=1 Tax=Phyllobacterium endophyticum TaxID=1149773 RepID=UPI0011C8B3B8|nr:M20/M25/M40 family metallo-hydrolase [Phyllobacterium endophyticum]TXR46350.1 M42 family metallopeptidase [Phyllobacterium endophyticum]